MSSDKSLQFLVTFLLLRGGVALITGGLICIIFVFRRLQ